MVNRADSLLVSHPASGNTLLWVCDTLLLTPPPREAAWSSSSQQHTVPPSDPPQRSQAESHPTQEPPAGRLDQQHAADRQPSQSLDFEQQAPEASAQQLYQLYRPLSAQLDTFHTSTRASHGFSTAQAARKPCYTITTWCPLPLLQQLQLTSKAICEAAAAGAIAAARTIPGGPGAISGSLMPQHSLQDSGPSTAAGCPASWSVRQLDPSHPGGSPSMLAAFSALPAQLLLPLCPELEAGSTAALQFNSAGLLNEMRSDDLQQQLQERVRKRQQQQQQQLQQELQLSLLEQHKRQQDAQQAPAMAPVKRRCFDLKAAATNNLSVRCHGPTNDTTSQHHPYDAGAATSDSGRCNLACTPNHDSSDSARGSMGGFSTGSPFSNNYGGHGMSPLMPAPPKALQHPLAVAAAAAAPLKFSWQELLVQAPAAEVPGADSRSDSQGCHEARPVDTAMWLGSDFVPAHQRDRSLLPTFTHGVRTLLTPSAREAAAPDAFISAACAAAATHGVHPSMRESYAKQLALAAVQAARTELAVSAAVPGYKAGRIVPRQAYDGCGWTGNKLSMQHPSTAVPAHSDSSQCAGQQGVGGVTPATSHDGWEPTQCSMQYPSTASSVQQQQQAQCTGAAAAWGGAGSSFAAPAATMSDYSNGWAVGVQGATGAAYTDWQQAPQDPAACASWAAGCAATAAGAQPFLPGGAPCVAMVGPDQQYYCPQGTDGCEMYCGYYFYQQQQQEFECPGSPQLEGVDHWSDQCSLMCFSNSWEAVAGGAEQDAAAGAVPMDWCAMPLMYDLAGGEVV